MSKIEIKKSFLFIFPPPSCFGIWQHPTIKCSEIYTSIHKSLMQITKKTIFVYEIMQKTHHFLQK